MGTVQLTETYDSTRPLLDLTPRIWDNNGGRSMHMNFQSGRLWVAVSMITSHGVNSSSYQWGRIRRR